jgi:hypothetical protein
MKGGGVSKAVAEDFQNGLCIRDGNGSAQKIIENAPTAFGREPSLTVDKQVHCTVFINIFFM